MGGRVLQYEAKDILNQGIATGWDKGLNEGLIQGIRNTVACLRNCRIPDRTILQQIVEQFHLSATEAQAYL